VSQVGTPMDFAFPGQRRTEFSWKLAPQQTQLRQSFLDNAVGQAAAPLTSLQHLNDCGRVLTSYPLSRWWKGSPGEASFETKKQAAL
jgi:hypothetical protein